MKHLCEEELIELYYGEGTSSASAHLRACRACSAEYASLKKSLDAVRTAAVPQKGPDYGERVWKSLQPQLIPYQKKENWLRWKHWRAAALAMSCAMVLVAVFLSGRYWERNTSRNARGTQAPESTQRVVVVVLTDHLDRTERLLVQLNHIDARDRQENAELQSQARELLASNRLYRTTAGKAGDPALAGALERLEGVLAEVANDPNLTPADITRLRHDMDSEGILFEIRVLLARSPNQVSGPKSAKGVAL